jgi:hypothetical protein
MIVAVSVSTIIRWIRGRRGYWVNTRLVDATMVVWRSPLPSWLLLFALETYYVQNRIDRVGRDPFGRLDRIASEEMLTAFRLSR